MFLKRQNISDLQRILVFCEYFMAFNISFLAFSVLPYGIFYLQFLIMEISKQIMNRVKKKQGNTRESFTDMTQGNKFSSTCTQSQASLENRHLF